MFGQDRDSLRRFLLSSWEKHQGGAELSALEGLIAGIIEQHPEYHLLLNDPDAALGHEASPATGESNPFLHMAMHITLAEQLSTDRPTGFRHLYQRILQASADSHDAEHHMMECLGLVLWEAQRAGRQPDEQAYLVALARLADSLSAVK